MVAASGAWLWSTREAAPASAGSVPVLAILPFVTAPQDAQHVGEGISDDLVNILSQLPQLKVKSTTIGYTGDGVDVQKIGRDLGVGVVVTGRAAQQDGMLVVQARVAQRGRRHARLGQALQPARLGHLRRPGRDRP